MIYIHDTVDFQVEENTVVAIGKFDGRHRGHIKLLNTMLEEKKKKGLKTAVFTFSTPPSAVTQHETMALLTTALERRNNLEKTGIDYLVEYPFNNTVAHMDPEEFVREILVKRMRMKVVVAGYDCAFGYRRAGNANVLKKLGVIYNYETVIIDKEQDDHRDISSTYIREELKKGNMEKAAELLGEPYAIHGEIMRGTHIGGSLLHFPTANIVPPSQKALPPYGVYQSLIGIEGKIYQGLTNVGKKPTVSGSGEVGVETYIYDYKGDCYGKMAEVQLLHFVRPERKFPDTESLKKQIEKDSATVHELHARKQLTTKSSV